MLGILCKNRGLTTPYYFLTLQTHFPSLLNNFEWNRRGQGVVCRFFFDENNNFSEYTVVSRYAAPVVVVDFHVQERLRIIQAAIAALPLEEW